MSTISGSTSPLTGSTQPSLLDDVLDAVEQAVPALKQPLEALRDAFEGNAGAAQAAFQAQFGANAATNPVAPSDSSSAAPSISSASARPSISLPTLPAAQAATTAPTAAPPQAATAATPAAQAAATTPDLPVSKSAFVNQVAPGAVAAQQKYGVPASVTIAQAILESGQGKSGLATKANNLFGIKGTGPNGSVTMPTKEYLHGQWTTVNAKFRAYSSDAQSIDDHAKLLSSSHYYTKAMSDRSNPNQFAQDLTGVYATDPNYGAKLQKVMQEYNLYQYDQVPAPAASTSAATQSANVA